MATTKSNEPLIYNRAISYNQKVWNYMRRNRTFKITDVMIITGMGYESLKNIIWNLRAVGYIKEVERIRPYQNSTFTLVKNTGVKAPRINKRIVRDRNTKEIFHVQNMKVKKSKLLTLPISRQLLTLIDSLTETKITKIEVCKKTGLPESTIKNWWTKLINAGVIEPIIPIVRRNRRKLFYVHIEKIPELREKLIKGKRYEKAFD
ncbi:hypothetical protein [Sulfurimonas sp.]|uniref:hypothetical protein n=1 Tax=Sulfurimonas sp. TaxID=2022749 RepID=UPI0025FDEC30|nr:hypothetical protein [Sulfurimonas sp.]